MALDIVLEEIDPETNCIAADWEILRTQPSDISAALDIDLEQEERPFVFDLTPEEVTSLKRIEGIESGQLNLPGRLRTKVATDDLPYKTHTGRELALMLSGRKPLAYFSYFDGEPLSIAIDQPFDEHVTKGELEYRHYRLRLSEKAEIVNYAIYTLPSEAWRADALTMLLEAGQRSGWCPGMERLLGSLLGYTDEENDVYLEWVAER
jgi:hypothetical protein